MYKIGNIYTQSKIYLYFKNAKENNNTEKMFALINYLVKKILPKHYHQLRQYDCIAPMDGTLPYLIAIYISKYLQIPIAYNISTSYNSKENKNLTLKQRIDNVKNIYLQKLDFNMNEITNKKILFVDDIVTSGATEHAVHNLFRDIGSQCTTICLFKIKRRFPKKHDYPGIYGIGYNYHWRPTKAQARAFAERMQDPDEQEAYNEKKKLREEREDEKKTLEWLKKKQDLKLEWLEKQQDLKTGKSLPPNIIGKKLIMNAKHVSQSPYGHSYYIFDNVINPAKRYKTWSHTPNKCIRISDHWNFTTSRWEYDYDLNEKINIATTHCITNISVDNNEEWAIGVYSSKKNIYIITDRKLKQ